MATDLQFIPGDDTIELQQQVARLQALLEASRQVHRTIHEDAVLKSVLRIVVRELEMAGAAFPEAGMSYGDIETNAGEGAGDGAHRRHQFDITCAQGSNGEQGNIDDEGQAHTRGRGPDAVPAG